MKKKQILSLLLALVMALSLAACGEAVPNNEPAKQEADMSNVEMLPDEEPAAEPQTETVTVKEEDTFLYDVDKQLDLIKSKLDELKQVETELPWYYTVVDLNRDGNIEFIAASQHPTERKTNLKMWTVNEDRTTLTECQLVKEEDESFPDIAKDSADTYFVESTGAYHYMFLDYVPLSDFDVYAVKSSFNLSANALNYASYGVEHVVVENGKRTVTHTDMEGKNITAEQFNRAEEETFQDAIRSTTNFEWMTAADLNKDDALRSSFEVFMGLRKQTQRNPVPQPKALSDEALQQTAQQQKPEQPKYLTITKNPTTESKRSGESATYMAAANVYDSLTWTFVAPNGKQYTPNDFARNYGAGIYGANSTTLSVTNVGYSMNGFGVYCTFYYKGQTARTTTALLWVANPNPVTPSRPTTESGEYKGTVIDYSYSTITVQVGGGNVCYVPRSVCMVVGDIYMGAPATVCWTRTNNNITYTYCEVEGNIPEPEPTFGSMAGTAYHDTAETVYVVLKNGVGYHLPGSIVTIVGGNEIEGASCVAYYEGEVSESTIYYLEINGYDNKDEEEGQYGDPLEGLDIWICPICWETNLDTDTCWCCTYVKGETEEQYWKRIGEADGWDDPEPIEQHNEWLCPVCESNNVDVTVCWSCGYPQGTDAEAYKMQIWGGYAGSNYYENESDNTWTQQEGDMIVTYNGDQPLYAVDVPLEAPPPEVPQDNNVEEPPVVEAPPAEEPFVDDGIPADG